MTGTAITDGPRRRAPRLVTAAGVGLLWLCSAAALSVWFAGRIRDWSVMTDELQYVKLALSAAETYSPLPAIHGTTVSAANQLYPLLLAPVYGPLSSTDAFRAAHALNAVLLTSAAIPGYLLAREAVGRAAAFAVALLTVLTPWAVLTGFLMSESAAYPAFLWALLAIQRTVVAPTVRQDLLAVLGLGVAVSARTQFAALALVLPLAILVHEGAGARGPFRGRLVSCARAAFERHRVLWTAYALAALVVAVVALAGYRVFGAYSTTVEGGSILPAGVWWSAVEHLAVVGLGAGLVPLVLGGSWLLAAALRPGTRSGSLAVIGLLTVAGLAVETASFDLRFGGRDVIRDRYLFYVVPLLVIGTAAAVTGSTPVRRLVAGVVALTVLVAAAIPGLPFTTFPGLSVDSPVSILNEALIDHAGTIGVRWFAALAVLLVGAVLVLALVVVPTRALAAASFAAIAAFSAAMLGSEANRVLDGTSLSQRPLAGPPGVVLDWVDAVVPPGERASIVPYPLSTAWGLSAIQWWNVEFWNRTITRAFVARDGNFTYANFPLRTISLDPTTGVVAGTARAPAYVVMAPGDSRFGLAGSVHAENAGVVVLAADRPYRAVWSSRGLRTDGWTFPRRRASIRVYGAPKGAPEVHRVTITLRAPPESAAAYRISTETADRPGGVSAGSTAEETVFLCVGPRAPVDVTLGSPTGVLVEAAPLHPEPGPMRRVGVGLGGVAVEPTGRPCG